MQILAFLPIHDLAGLGFDRLVFGRENQEPVRKLALNAA